MQHSMQINDYKEKRKKCERKTDIKYGTNFALFLQTIAYIMYLMIFCVIF